MKTVETIRAAIAAMEIELRDTATAELKSRADAIAAIPKQFVWQIEWLENGHTFRCERRWSDETIAAFESIGGNGKSTLPDAAKWHGASYTITLNHRLCMFGGGHCVLKTGQRAFDNDGWPLTPEQLEALRAGVVPVELISNH